MFHCAERIAAAVVRLRHLCECVCFAPLIPQTTPILVCFYHTSTFSIRIIIQKFTILPLIYSGCCCLLESLLLRWGGACDSAVGGEEVFGIDAGVDVTLRRQPLGDFSAKNNRYGIPLQNTN